ncbi:helix-turn-helix domain-containing protein [Streptomyces zhihengii]|uniref:helix-turn-helix domain-containing protein n=1 Tax=Streptomyces zhihengii TaxID=1818004 RepID=UPI0036A9D520
MTDTPRRTDTEEFAARLHALRTASGRTYDSLARRVGVGAATLHRYCSGRTVPMEFAPVERLARVCGCTPEDLADLHRLWLSADTTRRTRPVPTGGAAGGGGEGVASGGGAAGAAGVAAGGAARGPEGPGAPAGRIEGATPGGGAASGAGAAERHAVTDTKAPGTAGPTVRQGTASGAGAGGDAGSGAPAADTAGGAARRSEGPGAPAGRADGATRRGGTAARVRRRWVAGVVVAGVTSVFALVAGFRELGAPEGGVPAPPARAATAPAPATTPPRGASSPSPAPSPSAAAAGTDAPVSATPSPGDRPAATGAPIAWTGDDHVWQGACGHTYVIGRGPAAVPPPPTQADAASWASALGALHGGETLVRVTVQGTGGQPVVLESMQVRVVQRRAARELPAYRMSSGCGGSLTPRLFEVDLDRARPVARPVPGSDSGVPIPAVSFPYTVSSSDPEALLVSGRSVACDCDWVLDVAWSSGGRSGTVRIDDGGRPFRTTGVRGGAVYDYDYTSRGWTAAGAGTEADPGAGTEAGPGAEAGPGTRTGTAPAADPPTATR